MELAEEMAAGLKGLLNMTLSRMAKSINPQIFGNGNRFLFTPAVLGINSYLTTRASVKNQFLTVEKDFRTKMHNFINKDPDSMIFSEDLKAMLYLAQKTPEDLELMINMIKKYNKQNKELRFGTFTFGPVAMRTLYHLDEPDIALSLYKDPELEGFFDQMITNQILMDLLYNHGRYADVRNIFDIFINKTKSEHAYPRNSVILLMGSCYKENTQESLDYALNVWQDVVTKLQSPIRRAISFLCALALAQGKPHAAMELLTSIRQSQYIDTRCLRIMAYVEIERLDDIIRMFEDALDTAKQPEKKILFFSDTINIVEKVAKENNYSEDSRIMQLIKKLREYQHVQPLTLDEHLCKPIDVVRSTLDPRRLQRPPNRAFIKPGLRDLL